MKRIVALLFFVALAAVVAKSQETAADTVRGKVMSYEKGDVRKGSESEMLRDRLSPKFSYPGNDNTICQKVVYDLSSYGLNGCIILEVTYLFDIEQNIKMEAITLYGSPFGKKNDFVAEFPSDQFELVFYDKKKRILTIPLVFKDRETMKVIKELVFQMDR